MTGECALLMRHNGRARMSLLHRFDSHRVLRRCPGGVLVAAECRCVVGGTCDRVMGHHRALTSTCGTCGVRDSGGGGGGGLVAALLLR